MTKINKYDVNITHNQEIADAYNDNDTLRIGTIVSDLIRKNKERSEKYQADYKAHLRAEILTELASQP